MEETRVKSLISVLLLLVGGCGIAGGVQLIQLEYTSSRVHAKYPAQIAEGRIAQQLYDQEAALAWRDVALHLGILLVSGSMVYAGARRLRNQRLSERKEESVPSS